MREYRGESRLDIDMNIERWSNYTNKTLNNVIWKSFRLSVEDLTWHSIHYRSLQVLCTCFNLELPTAQEHRKCALKIWDHVIVVGVSAE